MSSNKSIFCDQQNVNFDIFMGEACAFAPTKTNDLIWGSFSDGSVRLFDPTSTDQPRVMVSLPTEQFPVLVEYEGAVAFSEGGEIYHWDTEGNLIQKEQTDHSKSVKCAFPSKTKKLWSGDSNGQVLIWEAGSNGTLFAAVKLKLEVPVLSMEEVENTMWLGSMGVIHKFITSTCELAQSWVAHAGSPIGGIVLSPSGNDVWTFSAASATICVWNAVNGDLVQTISDHNSPVTAMAKGSETIITASIDQALRVWEPSSLSCIETMKEAHNGIIRVLFTYERGANSMLLSSAQNGSAILWTSPKVLVRKHDQGSAAFPGIPMYSSVDLRKDTSQSRSASTLTLMDGSMAQLPIQERDKEQSVRLRFFDSCDAIEPVVERFFPTKRKASVCKEDLVVGAVSDLLRASRGSPPPSPSSSKVPPAHSSSFCVSPASSSSSSSFNVTPPTFSSFTIPPGSSTSPRSFTPASPSKSPTSSPPNGKSNWTFRRMPQDQSASAGSLPLKRDEDLSRPRTARGASPTQTFEMTASSKERSDSSSGPESGRNSPSLRDSTDNSDPPSPDRCNSESKRSPRPNRSKTRNRAAAALLTNKSPVASFDPTRDDPNTASDSVSDTNFFSLVQARTHDSITRRRRGKTAQRTLCPLEKVIVLRPSEGNKSFSPSDFVYKLPGFDIYLLKEEIPFHRMQFIQACKSGFLPPILDVVPIQMLRDCLAKNKIEADNLEAAHDWMDAQARVLYHQDLKVKTTIKSLMKDCPFESFVNRQCDEVFDFRRALSLERMKWYEEREKMVLEDPHNLPRYYCTEAEQPTIKKVKVEGHLSLQGKESDSVKKTICPNLSSTANEVLVTFYDAIVRTVPMEVIAQLQVSDFVLKVPGLSEFLYGDIPLYTFDYIRSSISSGTKICLRLVSLEEYTNTQEMNREPSERTLADQILSQGSAKTKEWKEPQSIYSIRDKLKINVTAVQALLTEHFERPSDDDAGKGASSHSSQKVVYIEAAVMYGDLLLDQGQTKPAPATSEAVWASLEGEITFPKISVQNIARGTRICFTLILEGTTKVPLFWCNKQLISHNSKSDTWSLVSGVQSMLMWPECGPSSLNLYKSIGLCSENVGAKAPNLVVEYPDFGAPVVFPPPPRLTSPQEMVDSLTIKQDIKKDLFELTARLKEPGFNLPFLESDGISVLCTVVRQSSGNVLSYALGALEVALEVSLTSGKGWESITLEDIEYIVQLTDVYHSGASPNLNAAKSALRFLSHTIDLSEALPTCHLGFGVVSKAMANVAKRNNTTLFDLLLSGLGSRDDIDISKESFRLINGLLYHAPDLDTKKSLVGSLVESGFHKIMREVLSDNIKNIDILQECRRYQCIRFKMLYEESKSPFTPNNNNHSDMLGKLYQNVFKKPVDSLRSSPEWKKLGFQQSDPAQDLRAMGILGLQHLCYISSVHKKEFRSIISQYNKTDPSRQYPLASAGMKISDLLLQLFQVGDYDREEERIYRILFDDDKGLVLEEMYVAIFKVVNKTWYDLKASSMDWPNVKSKVWSKVEDAFNNASTLKEFQKFVSGSPPKKATEDPFIEIDEQRAGSSTTLSKRMKEIERILSYDSLTRLTPVEKKFLWQERHFLVKHANALPKFLLSVNFQDYNQVLQCYSLLSKWEKPTPEQAIEMLDARFTDPIVRSYAVSRLDSLKDEDCEQIALQLCQVLKYEAYHDSALARFLVRRAYRNDKIGHSFFWNLRAELHIPEIQERYSLLLEGYVRGIGSKKKALVNQNEVMNSLIRIAGLTKKKPIDERKGFLRPSLAKVEDKLKESYDTLMLPLDHRLEAKGLQVEKCKSMDSKQVPLWLVFENKDPLGLPISIILKVGDDLRQDALTLQMMRLMDKLWKEEDMNLGLHLYGCVATGNDLGVLEIVKNAETTAGIQRDAGGAKSVLREDVLTNWLKIHNPGTLFQRAQMNFARSCAGYCVATYVLGIADRHNDNIMITKDGFLLHIDFGHFLGNYKKKFGYRRETTPFVFTAQYAHVLTGGKSTKTEAFEEFKTLCGRAYNVVRHHSALFLNLFQLMLCGGIQELQSSDDISHLRDALSLGLSDEDAAKKFQGKIKAAQSNTRQKIMDVAHILKH